MNSFNHQVINYISFTLNTTIANASTTAGATTTAVIKLLPFLPLLLQLLLLHITLLLLLILPQLEICRSFTDHGHFLLARNRPYTVWHVNPSYPRQELNNYKLLARYWGISESFLRINEGLFSVIFMFRSVPWLLECQWEGWVGWLVVWSLNVPATHLCISGTDLLRQVHMLPHWDRSCGSNFLPHPVAVYRHQANQSQLWPLNYRHLAG